MNKSNRRGCTDLDNLYSHVSCQAFIVCTLEPFLILPSSGRLLKGTDLHVFRASAGLVEGLPSANHSININTNGLLTMMNNRAFHQRA